MFAPAFQRKLRKKPGPLAAAIAECVYRLAEDPRHPGLQTHQVRGVPGVWEAYVDRANRVTFHYDGPRIVFRNHCNHDLMRQSP